MEKIKNNDLLQICGGGYFKTLSALFISLINVTRLVIRVGRKMR